jgi:MFS transporter, AAHS family, 4-hydroxybenzoate transporter
MDDAVEVQALIDKSRIGGYQAFIVFMGALILFLDGFDTQIASYIGPGLTRDWHISKTELGTIFSAVVWGLLIGYLVVAPLSRKWGARPVVIANIVLFGAATLLSALSHTPEIMFALRLIAGVGLAGSLPAAVAMAGEFGPIRRRSTFIALLYCGFSFGTSAAGVLAGLTLAPLGWRGFMAISGVIPLVVAAFLFCFLPESIEFMIAKGAPREKIRALASRVLPDAAIPADARFTQAPRDESFAPLQLFTKGRLLGTLMAWLALLMNLMGLYFALSWMPTIFMEVGYSNSEAVHLATIATSGGIVAALVLGPLMDWLGAFSVVTVLFLATGAFLCLTGFTAHSTAATLTASAFLMFGCMSGIQKCMNALLVFFYPVSVRSTGMGWAFGIGRLAGTISPVLVGFLLDHKWPVDEIFYLFSIPMIVGAVAVYLMNYSQNLVQHDPAPARRANPERAAFAKE